MIKLIVNPHEQPITYTFDKFSVVITCRGSTVSQPDLTLNSDSPFHVTISEQQGTFVAVNEANDPLTTINGLTFHRMPLKDHDLLQLGSVLIEFQGDAQEFSTVKLPKKEEEEELLFKDVENDDELLDLADVEAILDKTLASAQTPVSDNQSFTKLITPKPLSSVSVSPWGEPIQEAVSQTLTEDPDVFDLEAEMRELEILLGSDAHESSNAEGHEGADISTLLEKVEELESLFLESEETVEERVDTAAPSQDLADDDEPMAVPPEETDVKNPVEHRAMTSASTKPPVMSNYEPKAWEDKHPLNVKQPPPERKSLKDFYLSEFDDENENWNALKEKKPAAVPSRFSVNWKSLATALVSVAVIFIVGAGAFYWSASGKSFEEEVRAAEAVADVTMALNFAQINHTLPQNQNWSDPEFLKNNLTAVLASEYQPLANVDSHGQFLNAPYI